MKRKMKLLSVVAICGVATLGGIIAYNSSSDKNELFRKNIEALTDDGEYNSSYWDNNCQCWKQRIDRSIQF